MHFFVCVLMILISIVRGSYCVSISFFYASAPMRKPHRNIRIYKFEVRHWQQRSSVFVYASLAHSFESYALINMFTTHVDRHAPEQKILICLDRNFGIFSAFTVHCAHTHSQLSLCHKSLNFLNLHFLFSFVDAVIFFANDFCFLFLLLTLNIRSFVFINRIHYNFWEKTKIKIILFCIMKISRACQRSFVLIKITM